MNHATYYKVIRNHVGFIILKQMTEQRKLHVNNYTSLLGQHHELSLKCINHLIH
jgi:hypothetical protein